MINVPRVPPQNSPYPDSYSIKLFSKNWWLFFSSITAYLEVINDFVQSGTHADRLALNLTLLPEGALFVESDRNNLVYQIQDGAWQYVTGTYRLVQADISTLAATMTIEDTGLLIEVTDYRHVLQWDSSLVWKWGPAEDGRHDIAFLPIDPDDTTGWQLCDGSTINYLKGDGTTGSFTTPNLTGNPSYLKFGAAVAGPNAATAPTLTVGAINAATTGVNTVASAASTNVTPSGATLVSLSTHTHGINDPGHTHTMGSSSVAADGAPANYVARPWFRR